MTDQPTGIISQRILFTGRVQGVGFRYTTRSIARKHPVQGYVRNLADGTVELLAQGTIAAINDFLTEIVNHFEGNIAQMNRRTDTSAEPWTHFEIR